MAQYKNKFIEIDPETCSMAELKKAIDDMQSLSGYYETKQLALKTFINSVYGATASKYFVGHNTDVAESITLQGQDLNHFSENGVNRYFRHIFNTEEEYNKELYIPIFEYTEKYSVDNTTQFYAKDANKNWQLVNLPCTIDDINNNVINQDLKKVLKKNVFIKTTFGQYIGLTLEQVKAFDINKGRVTQQLPLDTWLKKYTTKEDKLNSKKNPFAFNGKETYLDEDPSSSLAIAGDTDSIDSLSNIFLDKSNITIEEAFNKLKYENRDCVLKLANGQEIVTVHNHTTKAFDENAPLMPKDCNIKYIMRHKVSKPKFKIKTKSGKEIIVTGDHSCMVYRDNKVIAIKAKDINPKTDKLIEIA